MKQVTKAIGPDTLFLRERHEWNGQYYTCNDKSHGDEQVVLHWTFLTYNLGSFDFSSGVHRQDNIELPFIGRID